MNMKNLYNILVPLLVGSLLLFGVFLLRTNGIDAIEENIAKSVKRIVHRDTSVEKLRTKSMEAFHHYTRNHKKMTGKKDVPWPKLIIYYELDELEDMYTWFKWASNNVKPQVISNNRKSKTYMVEDNGVDPGYFHIVLEVFNQPNNFGLIGILTYSGQNLDLYDDVSRVVIELYVPGSVFLRNY